MDDQKQAQQAVGGTAKVREKPELKKGSRAVALNKKGQFLMRSGEIKDAFLKGDISLEKIVDVAKGGLDAVILIKDAKGGFNEMPDYKTRLDYLRFITETVEGTPVKRQEIITRTVTRMEDLENAALQSPAFSKQLAKLAERTQAAAKSANDAEFEVVDDVEI
jgi:hypothetical protein